MLLYILFFFVNHILITEYRFKLVMCFIICKGYTEVIVVISENTKACASKEDCGRDMITSI